LLLQFLGAKNKKVLNPKIKSKPFKKQKIKNSVNFLQHLSQMDPQWTTLPVIT